MLAGSHVVLRPPHGDDADALAAMFAEPAVEPWWHGYDHERIVGELFREPSGYVIDLDGEVAGWIQAYEEEDPDYRSAAIDIAVATRFHGRGVAVDAIRTLAADLLGRRGHHRLTIDPAVANERAIACYRKLGFQPVGVLRQHERAADGTWRDALLLDLLAGELR